MENIKYWIISLLLLLIGFGWFTKSEETDTFDKERILNKQEVIKHIKNPQNTWYFKRSTYTIIKKRSNIPFYYTKIDTLKKPVVGFYWTNNPNKYNKDQEDDSCGCN